MRLRVLAASVSACSPEPRNMNTLAYAYPYCLSTNDLTFLPRHGRSEELSLFMGLAKTPETRN